MITFPSLLPRSTGYLMLSSIYRHKNKPLHAHCFVHSASDSDYKKRLNELNDLDQKEATDEKISKLEKIMPNVVKLVKDKDDVLDELDFICVMYTPPINAERRINLRNSIQRLIEKHKLTGKAVEDLLDFLKKRGAY